MMDIMSLLQSGRVSLGFIGGAEVDQFGNLNTTYIGGRENVMVRLPGSGGGSDIASLSQRLVIIMNHEKRRFVRRVGYMNWRQRVGLRGGGPCAVITNRGILRFDSDTKEMVLDSVHPGVSVEEILEHTGWQLRLASKMKKTEPPTKREIRIIRKYDPRGFWTQLKRSPFG
jgi:glutaconate CoA-transferase subunit B